MAHPTATISPTAFSSFGELLRYLRRRAKLSQIELAIAVGYSTAQISRLEQNQRPPNPSTLLALFVPALGLEEQPELAARLLELARQARGEQARDRRDLPTPTAMPTPAATVAPDTQTTFLFTDIEGSTQLWERHPEAMRSALARHDAILRHAVEEYRGVVVKSIGDGVHAVFTSPIDAAMAALAAQRALRTEPWGEIGALRVRMALHTGVAEERDGDYFGPALNLVARLLAAGHGGQVLLSQTTQALLREQLPRDLELRDLGAHRLKDLIHPEQIFQLLGSDLPTESLPLRGAAAQPITPLAAARALLTTKLYVPPPRPNLVARPRLLARLQAGLRGKLTLLVAPAGFGKTTLLSAWIADCRLQIADCSRVNPKLQPPISNPQSPQVAWVSLDAGDNDPARFWSYVFTALERLLPGVAETALALLQSSQPPAETLLPSLLNALSARATDCVLVLDDYHGIDAAAIHAGLSFLLERLPPTLHLVIASRAEPPLPLARLRARGELSELRAPDLRFTPDEAASFLTEVMDLTLSFEEVAALERRTEGWVAGLQLAALAMRERRDLASFISAFTGSQRFVGEYLAEDVFARQPAHIQTFLLQTSILSRMCGPLCDAVMLGGADGAPADSFSQVVLEELERANLFVVPLDDEQRWYRYHHLFGEMLRERLLSGASAAAVARLHRRASAWYEGQGLVVEAVQHALAAQDWEPAARLIEDHGALLGGRGQVHTIVGWLNALPAAVMQRRPHLCIVHAAGLLMTKQLDAAEARLDDAECSLPLDMPDDVARVVRGRVALVRGIIRFLTGDLPQVISLMQQALALMPEPTTSVAAEPLIAMVRAVATMFAAMVYKRTGDVTEASERRASEAIAPVRATDNLTETLYGYTSLAYLQVLQGRLRTAAATYAEVERLIPGPDALQAVVGSPAYYFGMGDLLREWNQLDPAGDYLAPGMVLVQGGLVSDADTILLGYRALAQVQQARGQGQAALATLNACMQLAQERKFFGMLVEQAAALRARLQLMQGELGAALRWADGSRISLDDEISFPREVAYLTLVRVRISAGHAQAVLPLLSRLLADAESKARMHSAIEILIVQALAYAAQGDLARARTALSRALALAEPEGYVRMFVDEGAPLAALLRELRAQGTMLSYIDNLLAAFPDEGRRINDESTVGILSRGDD
jgi:LuxR family transcriptional regulator, maltose regulon positive regulatory protein